MIRTKIKTTLLGAIIIVVFLTTQGYWGLKREPVVTDPDRQRLVTVAFFASPKADGHPPRYDISGHAGSNPIADVDTHRMEWAETYVVNIGDEVKAIGVAKNGPFMLFRCDIHLGDWRGPDITLSRIRDMSGHVKGSYTSCFTRVPG